MQASADSLFDGPLGERIAAEINRQVDGLPKDQAFATLNEIIETETGKAEEATVRVSYAYHRIGCQNLWNIKYASLRQWESTLERDVEAINRQAQETLHRIKKSAETIMGNWGIPLDSIAEKPSRELARQIALLSTVCPNKERASVLMESCRQSRIRAEPEDRGPGVSRTERLLPMDVRNAAEKYKATLLKKRSISSTEPASPVPPTKQTKTHRRRKVSAQQLRHLTAAPSNQSLSYTSPEVARCRVTPLDDNVSPFTELDQGSADNSSGISVNEQGDDVPSLLRCPRQDLQPYHGSLEIGQEIYEETTSPAAGFSFHESPENVS